MKNFVLSVAFILQAILFPAICHAANSPLIWNTFLGGNGDDIANSINVDSNGNIFVLGTSQESWGTPVNPFGGSKDAFLAEFDAGGVLHWQTFLGGSGNDSGRGISFDGSGNIYIAGNSTSSWGSPLQSFSGSANAFVAKIAADGTLLWNTFLNESAEAIQVDASGNINVVVISSNEEYLVKFDASGNILQTDSIVGSGKLGGWHIALDGTLYWTGSWIPSLESDIIGDLAVYNPDGSFKWGDAFACDFYTSGNDVTDDSGGNAYVTGEGDCVDWEILLKPIRPLAGDNDAFVAKFYKKYSEAYVKWYTYLGGSARDWGKAIAIDGSNNTYVAGSSESSWGAPLRSFSLMTDAFVARIDENGGLRWHAFLGGNGNDSGGKIALDNLGNIYVLGSSNSSWGDPLCPYNEGYDVFLAKVANKITITSPDGGEDWPFKSLQNITWKAPGLAGNVALSLYRNGVRIGPIATCPAARGYYAWKAGTYGENLLPVPAAGGYAVKIAGSGSTDMSDGTFSIYKPIPSLEVTSPKDGEGWLFKSLQKITWTAKNMTGSVALNLYRDGRKIGWIASCPATRGSYSWKVGTYGDNQLPVPAGSGYSIVITRPGLAAASPGTFSIFRP